MINLGWTGQTDASLIGSFAAADGQNVFRGVSSGSVQILRLLSDVKKGVSAMAYPGPHSSR
jgi:hypothetical protein